jgi:hypothetical protein
MMRKKMPLSDDGRLWLWIGRPSKAEQDAYFAKQGDIVGFTRSAPRSSPSASPTPPPAPQSPAPEVPHPDAPRRTDP